MSINLDKFLSDRDPNDIADYATQAALRELFENWKSALRDGETIERLSFDIFDVIAELRRAREELLEQHKKTAAEVSPTAVDA